MAKKKGRKRGGVNKSQEIRDYMKDHPDEGPTAVAAALTAKGVDVTPEFVSTVKSTDLRKGKKGKRGKRGRRAVPGSISDTIKALESAKKLVDQLGGVSEAKSAIDAYAKLFEK